MYPPKNHNFFAEHMMTSYVIRHFSACIFQFVFFENAVTAKQFDVYVHHLNFTVRLPHRKLQCNQFNS